MAQGQTDLPPRLAGAIRMYLDASSVSRPVSIEHMLRTARYALPGLVASDDELAELIARELVQEGCDVDFDRAEDAAPRARRN